MKFDRYEKKQIKRCLDMDISELEIEIEIIKHIIDSISTNRNLRKFELINILKSLKFDMHARIGTESFKDEQSKIMRNVFRRILTEEFFKDESQMFRDLNQFGRRFK